MTEKQSKNNSRDTRKQIIDGSLFKIIFIGDKESGKFDILNRYSKIVFDANVYDTIGVNFYSVRTEVDINNYAYHFKLQIWELSEDKKLRFLFPYFIKGAHVNLLIFNENSYNSFVYIMDFFKNLSQHLDYNVPCVLVSIKNNLDDKIKVPKREISEFISEFDLDYLKISTIIKEDIDKLFELVVYLGLKIKVPKHRIFFYKKALIIPSSDSLNDQLSILHYLSNIDISNLKEEDKKKFTKVKKYIKKIMIKPLSLDDDLWKNFIMSNLNKIETQFWDLKQTLHMWLEDEPVKKEKAEIKFCEHIAAFANEAGGLLIVGISNKIPRKILGITDLENKKKYIKRSIKKWIDYKKDFVTLNDIILKDHNNFDVYCLIILVAQTKEVIGVRHRDNLYSYPIRLETGIERVNIESVKEKKKGVDYNNSEFLFSLIL